MCDYDCDPPEVDNRRWIKARKEHTCYACPERIRIGDRYHFTLLINERGEKPQVFRHCARCWMVCEALWKAGAMGIDFALDCGERWEDNFDSAEEPVDLAFLTRDEAQLRVMTRVRPPA